MYNSRILLCSCALVLLATGCAFNTIDEEDLTGTEELALADNGYNVHLDVEVVGLEKEDIDIDLYSPGDNPEGPKLGAASGNRGGGVKPFNIAQTWQGADSCIEMQIWVRVGHAYVLYNLKLSIHFNPKTKTWSGSGLATKA